jgi:hypothetical protein
MTDGHNYFIKNYDTHMQYCSLVIEYYYALYTSKDYYLSSKFAGYNTWNTHDPPEFCERGQ